jgi:hypothetical protein
MTSQQGEARGLNGLFVKAGWHEKEEATGGAKIKLTFGNLASDYSIIGKYNAPFIAKQATPLAQSPKTVR